MAKWGFADLEALWEQAGGSKALAPVMAAIALAESEGDQNARNPSGASGLWQILLPANAGYVPGGAGNVFNPLANAKAAVAIEKAQGLSAWSTYTNGAYKKFYKGGVPPSTLQQDNPPGGGLLGLPSQVIDFFTTAEKFVHALLWLVNPASWMRILAGFFAVLTGGIGLWVLAKSAG
jgi:hypothetical protein